MENGIFNIGLQPGLTHLFLLEVHDWAKSSPGVRGCSLVSISLHQTEFKVQTLAVHPQSRQSELFSHGFFSFLFSPGSSLLCLSLPLAQQGWTPRERLHPEELMLHGRDKKPAPPGLRTTELSCQALSAFNEHTVIQVHQKPQQSLLFLQ